MLEVLSAVRYLDQAVIFAHGWFTLDENASALNEAGGQLGEAASEFRWPYPHRLSADREIRDVPEGRISGQGRRWRPLPVIVAEAFLPLGAVTHLSLFVAEAAAQFAWSSARSPLGSRCVRPRFPRLCGLMRLVVVRRHPSTLRCRATAGTANNMQPMARPRGVSRRSGPRIPGRSQTPPARCV